MSMVLRKFQLIPLNVVTLAHLVLNKILETTFSKYAVMGRENKRRLN